MSAAGALATKKCVVSRLTRDPIWTNYVNVTNIYM